MALVDSIDKIVFSYFKAVTNTSFTYKNKVIEPRDLRVSPLLLRGFTCPADCGACCPRFSLDYLPNEPHPYELQKRIIEFNGTEITIYSDTQKDHSNHFCRNLNKDNGRCGIHGHQPFSCDFELIRFLNSSKEKPASSQITQKLFSRKWMMKNVRGEVGTSCEMTPPTQDTVQEVKRKLSRLEQWCFHFGLTNTKIPELLILVDNMAEKAIKGYELDNQIIYTNKPKTLF